MNVNEPQDNGPPWIKHWQHNVNGKQIKYKVGDTKNWKGETWHYCDCPNHRNCIKWHLHTAEDCTTRQRWLKKEKIKIEANAADADDEDSEPAEIKLEPPQPSAPGSEVTPPPTNNDVTSLLATALNLLGDNPTARDLVADALNAAHYE